MIQKIVNALALLLYLIGYWLLFVTLIYACFFKPVPRSLISSLYYITRETDFGLIVVLLLTTAILCGRLLNRPNFPLEITSLVLSAPLLLAPQIFF